MRKLILPIMIVAVIFAFYEQTKPQPNIWITLVSIVIFMLGMMWLSSKTPSKNKEDHGDDI